LSNFDLLIGGSPCQDLSVAKQNRKGLDGLRSGLFFKYVEITDTKKPKYFILENVASMRKEDRDKMSQILGIEPILINSALVSAQSRKRLFWVGKLVNDIYEKVEIEQPIDKGILLKDIIEREVDNKYSISQKGLDYMNSDSGKYSNRWSFLNDDTKPKSQTLVSNLYKGLLYNVIKVQDIFYLMNEKMADKKHYIEKSPTLLQTHYKEPITIHSEETIRKITPIECERLQTFPDNSRPKKIYLLSFSYLSLDKNKNLI